MEKRNQKRQHKISRRRENQPPKTAKAKRRGGMEGGRRKASRTSISPLVGNPVVRLAAAAGGLGHAGAHFDPRKPGDGGRRGGNKIRGDLHGTEQAEQQTWEVRTEFKARPDLSTGRGRPNPSDRPSCSPTPSKQERAEQERRGGKGGGRRPGGSGWDLLVSSSLLSAGEE